MGWHGEWWWSFDLKGAQQHAPSKSLIFLNASVCGIVSLHYFRLMAALGGRTGRSINDVVLSSEQSDKSLYAQRLLHCTKFAMKRNLQIHANQWITSLFGGQQELVWWVNRLFSPVALVFPIQIMWRYLRALSLCRVHQKDCVRAWKCRPTLEKKHSLGYRHMIFIGKTKWKSGKGPTSRKVLMDFSWRYGV